MLHNGLSKSDEWPVHCRRRRAAQETTQIHRLARRRGGVSARRARATAVAAGDRISQQLIRSRRSRDFLRGFHHGLKDAGYVEGENVAVAYRWAENQIDRLPELAAELVRSRVAVIAASGGPASASAAKATAVDPRRLYGCRPRSGQTWSGHEPRPAGRQPHWRQFLLPGLAAKRLELLRALAPNNRALAMLLNPAETAIAAANLRDVEAVGPRVLVPLANPRPQRQHH